MKDWCEVKKEFEADGSLRDIYILGASVKIWNEFIKTIQKGEYQFIFTHGSSERPLPDNFSKIKAMQEANPTTLSILLNKSIQINCHFFVDTEIELDISPKEIKDSAEFELLMSFIKWLSDTLRKPAIVTHEGSQNQIILSVGEYVV